MICVCELLEEESATLSLDFDGPFDGEFTPWLVGPGVPLHRDLVRHDHRCPMFERACIREELLAEVDRLVWDEVPSEAPSLMEKVTTAFDRICPAQETTSPSGE